MANAVPPRTTSFGQEMVTRPLPPENAKPSGAYSPSGRPPSASAAAPTASASARSRASIRPRMRLTPLPILSSIIHDMFGMSKEKGGDKMNTGEKYSEEWRAN